MTLTLWWEKNSFQQANKYESEFGNGRDSYNEEELIDSRDIFENFDNERVI